MSLRLTILSLFLFGFLSSANALPLEKRDLSQSEVRFIQCMVQHHHFNEVALTNMFQKVQPLPDVIRHMQHPYEAKPWYIYRTHFLGAARIKDGVAFWKQHHDTLQQAERQYGVPASIIVAIIGIESDYGQRMATYPTLATLVTLAFHYPARQHFFTHELKEFLLLTREQDLTTLDVMGSYAGAIGMPQFMPSSYRLYAVPAPHHTHSDLSHSPKDAIVSVANFLAQHGWKRNQPFATRATAENKTAPSYLKNQLKPIYLLADMLKHGVHPTKEHFSPQKKVGLITLNEDKDTPTYRLTFKNFYVMTQYNRSLLYAMAVFELSRKLSAAMQTY